MVHQFIAGGANGLIFFDYSEMKKMDYKNPLEIEWQKILNVVNEIKDKYVNIILSRTKPNPNYILPKFDNINGNNYFGRRIFRYNHSDYVLIVNVRNKAYKVTIYKPSTTSSIENYGSNEQIDMKIEGNTVTLDMPKASYIWLKGKDNSWDPPEDNNKQNWNGEGDEESNLILLGIPIPSLILLIAGIIIGVYFYFKKCKKSKDDELEQDVNTINSKIVDDKK